MTNRERISGVDTAWLRMEHPTNLMMIVGVLMFDGRVKPADVKRALRSRFLAIPRFGQRAVQDAAGAWWERCDDLDLDDHLERVRLPAPAGKAELQSLVSRLASTPLDPARPLWHFTLVDNYAGGSALIARVHHCYADGIALIQVMLSLTHASAEGSLAEPEAPPAKARGSEAQAQAGPADGFLGELLKPVVGAFGGARALGAGLLEQGRSIAGNPQLAREAAEGVARKGAELAAELARLALMGPDAATRFKGALGTAKRAAWADPLPLEEVKAVGKALGCSINDVLLSLAAGALRDYLADHGDAVEGLEIRAIVPVNLRPPGEAGGELGNRFGLVFLDLPLGIEHPLERLYEVRRRMRALKGSMQPIIALGLLGAVGHGPRVLQEQVTRMLASSASAVMTNVPGPQQPLYFAGRRIAGLNFWVPQSGGIGMGVSILSYDGRIQFGLVTDEGLVPDPDRIVGRFGDEFAKLLWITLMSPWGEEAAEAAEEPALPKRPAKAGRVPRRFRTA